VAAADLAARYTTHSFEHDGHRLVYDVYGDGPRVVVYLHGLLLDSDLNRGIATALAERGYRVVLLDLLGHGRSDAPLHAAEYRIDSYADQVVALLDHLGIDEAVLGGLSLGANVSLFVATLHPERVQGLVLEMPVLEWAVPFAALTFVPLLLAAHYGRPVLGPITAGLRSLPRLPFPPANSLLHAAGTRPTVLSAVMHGVLVGPVAPTQDERRRIEAPTLVLAHRHDRIHPFDDAVNLTRQLPHGELLRAWTPVELRIRPRRLTAAIGDFVGRAWDADARTAHRVGEGRVRPLRNPAG
jgi:pimeloyl-ACP methyl ester carboxylesterase